MQNIAGSICTHKGMFTQIHVRKAASTEELGESIVTKSLTYTIRHLQFASRHADFFQSSSKVLYAGKTLLGIFGKCLHDHIFNFLWKFRNKCSQWRGRCICKSQCLISNIFKWIECKWRLSAQPLVDNSC